MKSAKFKAYAAVLALAVWANATAQDAAIYPNRPVTIILPIAGTSTVDMEYRLYIEAIQKRNGPNYVIDYKGGAGGGVGMAYVAKAAPDGYTLLGALPSLITVPLINQNQGLDNIRDFSPITLFSKRFFMLVVHPSSPFKTVKNYIDYARSHPGELNWSTSGIGSSTHMPGELLHALTKTKVTFVHYKSGNQRLFDLIAGRVHIASASPNAIIGHVKSGKLRAIGSTGSIRSKLLPDVPAISSEVPGYEYATWVGLLAPAKVPPTVISTNLAIFRAAAKDPDVVKKLASSAEFVGNFSSTERVLPLS